MRFFSESGSLCLSSPGGGSVAVMLRREPKDFTSRGLSDDGERQTGINGFSQIQDQFCGVFAARVRQPEPLGRRRHLVSPVGHLTRWRRGQTTQSQIALMTLCSVGCSSPSSW